MSYGQALTKPAERGARSFRPKVSTTSMLEGVGVLLSFLFIALPIVWLAMTAFKNEGDAFTAKVFFTPTVQNFITIFNEPYRFGPLIINSVIVSLVTVAIGIPIALMAAYAFSRYVFVGSNILMVWVLTTQFIPAVVIAIPFYTLFRGLRLLDTRTALVILNLSAVLPYAIWMLKGFVDTLPTEVEEAALVDGASEFGIIRHITLPLVMPGVIVSAVFSFIMCWNEFLFALIMTSQDAKTLQIGLLSTNSVRGVEWQLMSAGGLIVMVPIFVMSLAIRKHFVQGLTMGAVK